MGKWLSRVIEKSGSQGEKYQESLINNTDKTDRIQERDLPDSKPDREKSFEETTRLFQERGWVQIWSTYLNASIYLARHKSTQVPDPSLAKYTKDEVDALQGLSLDELKTLHEAKVLFRGNIFKKQRN